MLEEFQAGVEQGVGLVDGAAALELQHDAGDQALRAGGARIKSPLPTSVRPS